MLSPNFLDSHSTIVIDGGLSNVLESLGCDLNHKLWTANLLENNPESIIQTHLEYIKAGSQVISTASYQASIQGLMNVGFSNSEARQLILKSVQLAEAAIEKAAKSGIISKKPLIAASIGPYGAFLADGSEYKGNYGISDGELIDFHRERILLLDQSNADLLAIETIPSMQEAKVLSDILKQCQTPAWISFSCKNGQHLNDGNSIIEVVLLFKNHPTVFAVGVNCTHPKYISELIQNIKSAKIDKKIIVYPNSGEAFNAETKTWLGVSEPTSFVQMSQEWKLKGADIIGGCCRIGPNHIKNLSDMMNNIK